MGQDRSTQRKPNKQGSGGKLANDLNKLGAQSPTQKNQGRRTPLSRSDRLVLRGADNQSHSRRVRPQPPQEP
jgi:hypothetical protein